MLQNIFILCAKCFGSDGAIIRETNSRDITGVKSHTLKKFKYDSLNIHQDCVLHPNRIP
jgi:hypothetical protein